MIANVPGNEQLAIGNWQCPVVSKIPKSEGKFSIINVQYSTLNEWMLEIGC
jgi:hypothetical protein